MSESVFPPDWSALLVEAVTKPGIISDAYRRFWNYSPGNQILAWEQCMLRHLELGPINTFQGWRELSRYVRRGERAITLCMPVTVKKKEKSLDPPVAANSTEQPVGVTTFTRFIYRPNWFVLCQTEGKEYMPLAVPEWTEARALSELQVERVEFHHPDGNAQGYAKARQVAVSLVAFMPHRTLFHEVAHVVLGHTAELAQMTDGEERTPRDIREVEAECTALICCQSLGLPGAEFSRGYIQHWLADKKITERSAQRIFKAADVILKAGRPKQESEDK